MRRIPELDALRGLAALTVMAFHFWPETFFFGWAAVDLFFVLSGYLITTILLDHRGSSRVLPAFYARRALRIWPIYYLAFVGLVLLVFGARLPVSLDAWPYFLTYTQNAPLYVSADNPRFIRGFLHTWTLALEEQFYLVWPAIVLVLRGRGLVIFAAGSIAVASAFARGMGLHPYLLAARCDGFALGGLLAALLFEAGTEIRRRTGRRSALIGLLAATYLATGSFAYGGPDFLGNDLQWPRWPGATILAISVLFLAVVASIVLGHGARGLAWLRGPRLVYLGTISYGLYLYHFPIWWALTLAADRAGWGRPPWLGLVAFGPTLAISALSWTFIERPLLTLKDHFSYSGRISRQSRVEPDPVG